MNEKHVKGFLSFLLCLCMVFINDGRVCAADTTEKIFESPLVGEETGYINEFEVDQEEKIPDKEIISQEERLISAYGITTGDDYPSKYKDAAQDSVVDEWLFYNRECTSFVAWCLNSRNGVSFTNWYGGVQWGNANTWGSAARNCGIAVDMNPSKGAVFWSDQGNYGHVAWVSAVNGDMVTIEEYNWGWTGSYGTRNVAANTASGYIHIKDIDETEYGSRLEHGGYHLIPDGDYHIVTALDKGACLDVWGGPSFDSGANVQIWHTAGASNQVFTVQYCGDGFYKITHKVTGKCLDVQDGSLANGANVQQCNDNGSDAQQWVIHEKDDGEYYTVQSRCNGYFLDVESGRAENGTNVQVCKENTEYSQKWRFVPWAPSIGKTIDEGEYQIVPIKDNNKTMSAEGNGTVAGTNVVLDSRKGDNRHTFDVTYLDDGYYSIINKNSGLSLDVYNRGQVNRTNIQLDVQNNKDSQKWIIKDVGDGYFNIISQCNCLYVELSGNKAVDGQNISMWIGNGGDQQKWKFIPWVEEKLDMPKTDIPDGSEVKTGTKISLSCDTEDVEIYYTLDGTDPTVESSCYSEPITIEDDTVIKAIATKEGRINSDVSIFTYKVLVYTVTFDANGGTKSEESTRTVKSGKTIGTLPSVERDGYILNGWYTEKEDGSRITEETVPTEDMIVYAQWERKKPEKLEKPVADIVTGTEVKTGTSVSLTSNMEGAQIHYTLDDTVPTAQSKVYSVPITIEKNIVIQAIAVKEGYEDSDVAVFRYTVSQQQENDNETKDDNETKEDNETKDDNEPEDGVLKDDIPFDGIPKGFWVAKVKAYTYTGAGIRPEVHVYSGNRRLKEGKDYTVRYKNNKKAASASERKAPTVIVKGKGNYYGTCYMSFTIKKARLDVSNVTAASVYHEKKVCTPTVMIDGNILKVKKDYTLTWQDEHQVSLKKRPSKEGRYIINITGKGSCEGTVSIPFSIAEGGSIDIRTGKASVGSMAYGGKLPTTSLTVRGQTLKQDKDYTVTFTGTNAAGKATAVFTGIGDYTGFLKKTFKVKPAPLPSGCITVTGKIPYEKGGAKPEIIVRVGMLRLTEGRDFTIKYTDNYSLTDKACVTIKGMGNYSGSQSADFQIVQKKLDDVSVRVFVSDTFIGREPTVVVFDTNGKRLSSGTDYEAEMDTDNHTVTIQGGTNGLYYTNKPVVKTYREIIKDNLVTSVSFDKKSGGFPARFEYTGNGIEVDKRWLKVKSGKKILSSKDFEIAGYVANVERGTATVIIQGTGQYGGLRTLNFKISPQKL